MEYLPFIFLTVMLGIVLPTEADETRWRTSRPNQTRNLHKAPKSKHVPEHYQTSAHKRQPHLHPHRNRTQSVRKVATTSSSSNPNHLFSQTFFHHLQSHLGLRLETDAPRLDHDKLQPRSARVDTLPHLSDSDSDLLPLGYPWHENSHVPFRYRYKYSSYFYAPKAQPEDPSMAATRTIDPCMLARWNYELPFSELPNMAANLLATDMVSGETTAAKARFMFELLHLSLESYLRLESSTGDVFEIPLGFDLGKCNLKKSEDPLLTSVNHLLKLYSDQATTTELLFGLVKAAKACLGREDKPFPLELLPCLDFSFGSEQVLKQTSHKSIFSNEEICRKYLNPVIRDCVPIDHQHPCIADHIEALNTFARHFYQCPDTLVGASRQSGMDGSSDTLHSEEDDYGLSTGSECRRWLSQSLTLTLGLLAGLSIGWPAFLLLLQH